MSNYPPQYAYPSAPPMVRALPSPPRLHWGVVLALQIITLGLFAMIWYVVQANWARKVTGRKVAFCWALAYLLFLPGVMLLGAVLGIVAVVSHVPVQEMTSFVQGFARLAAFVLAVGTAFSLRSTLEAHPIGMSLSGVMTFFFGTIYFQYHLRDWTPEGEAGAASVMQGLGLGGAVAPIVVASAEPGPTM